MFDTHAAETDEGRSHRLSKGMARLSPQLPELVYTAFLAERPGFEDDLLLMLRLGFERGDDPASQMQHPFVSRVVLDSGRANKEAHKFRGIARFSKAHTDLFIGDISPDCNILPLVGEHFHDRFQRQRFMLRDVKRMTAIVSDDRAWWIIELPAGPLAPLPEDESFATQWHAYFRAIAIPERANPRLQQHYVPLKYRRFLKEFE